MPQFDPTISWGTLISVGTIVVTVAIAYLRIKDAAHRAAEAVRAETERDAALMIRRLDRIETKLNIVWSSWKRRVGESRAEDDEGFFNGGTESR